MLLQAVRSGQWRLQLMQLLAGFMDALVLIRQQTSIKEAVHGASAGLDDVVGVRGLDLLQVLEQLELGGEVAKGLLF